jgi:Zn-dependent protease with chaperone function
MEPSAKWAEIAAQAIFHTLVASLYVEALVRSWRVTEPRQRMALRLVALGYPLVVVPALQSMFPFRLEEPFHDGPALFVARRWGEVRVLGVGLFDAWLALFAALGALLFLMDLLPLARGLRRPRPVPAEPDPASAAALAEVPALAAALGVRPPPVVFLDRDAPVLFCTGVRRHAIVVSRGALRILDPQELRAALSHELAHLARHDPAASWAVMAARALMWFNPAFQVLSRALAHDAEWLADEHAAAACGDRLALASGLIKLHRATAAGGAGGVRRALPLAGALAEPLARVRSLDVEVRCRRLLERAPVPLPFLRARVTLAAASLVVLLFFVV